MGRAARYGTGPDLTFVKGQTEGPVQNIFCIKTCEGAGNMLPNPNRVGQATDFLNICLGGGARVVDMARA